MVTLQMVDLRRRTMGGPNITVPRDRTVDVCKMIWTPYPPSSFSLEVEGKKIPLPL